MKLATLCLTRAWMGDRSDQCSAADANLDGVSDLHSYLQTNGVHSSAEEPEQDTEDDQKGVLAGH
ncbi:hypothetical protein E2C01_004644 [Portunus trituberculatus]|uniref:Uncharacterized protein n=1 Tax=Portunus trituberculatus TaxID=210409 RepID=A0A5B7CQ78_PORTR|nr:hypothetical protein [Portunus trituberculatus]